MWRPLALLVVLGSLAPGLAPAHEVRPALLDIRQLDASSYSIVWKRPAQGDVSVHLTPHLSTGWIDQAPQDRYSSGSYLIDSWSVTSAPPQALDQATLTVEGLQGTLIDVLVRVALRDGRLIEGVVRPEHPQLTFAGPEAQGGGRWQVLKLGIHHILTGPDHLLFVFGLLCIAKRSWMLLKAISGFTLAHSLTLAIATLWRLDLPVALLDMLVAFSIVFLALELVRAHRGGTSLSLREPLIPAFAFGLLHGLAFATGLAALDLRGGALLGALLQFNLGVEIGQLAFVGAILALAGALRVRHLRWPRVIELAPAYLIGITGTALMFQCGAAVLAGV